MTKKNQTNNIINDFLNTIIENDTRCFQMDNKERTKTGKNKTYKTLTPIHLYFNVKKNEGPLNQEIITLHVEIEIFTIDVVSNETEYDLIISIWSKENQL